MSVFYFRRTAPALGPRQIDFPKYAIITSGGAGLIVVTAWGAATWILRGFADPAVAAADLDVTWAIRAFASDGSIEAFSWLSRLHGTAGILALTALVAAWVARGSQHAMLPVLTACVPGGLMLNFAVKNAVQRARPETLYAAERLSSFSFPSGHTAGATVLYGCLVALLWTGSPVGLRAALVAGATLLVALVATSRIMLGVHYPSDCAVAVLEGLVWICVCFAAARQAT